MNKKKIKEKDDAGVLTKRTKGEKIVFGIVFGVFLIYSICMLYPLFYLLVNSFQDATEYLRNRMATNRNPFTLPWPLKWENYGKAFTLSIGKTSSRIYLYEMLFNSIWYCAIVIFEQVMMSCFTGYALSKYDFKLRPIFWALIMFSMTIPVVGTTGAMFKLAADLNFYDTALYVILVNLGGLGFNFIVMYGFFQNVSWSYAEAVFLDGGSHLTAFFKVMLPQAKMPIITLSIILFIQSWNEYMTQLLYLPSYPTLAAGIYRIKRDSIRDGDMPYYFAGLMIATIPVIVVFSCCSDIIMKNFSVGGLKG